MTQRRGKRPTSSRPPNTRPRARRAGIRHRPLRGELLEVRAMLTAAAGAPSPWQNPIDPLDVDGDTHLSPTDAILVINYLNAALPAHLPAEYAANEPCYDVDGDLSVSPTDAVLVINALNATGTRSVDSPEAADGSPATGTITSGDLSIVVPGSEANRDGSGMNSIPFSNTPNRRYQQIYSASEFAAEGIIDAIRFRRDRNHLPFTATDLNVQINLAYAATTVATASSIFADNIGGGNVVVYSGSLTFSSSGSGTPNPFDIFIDVDNVFDYNPALGDLLLDIRVLSNSIPGGALDASIDKPTTIRIVGQLNASSGLRGINGEGSFYGLVTRFDLVGPTPVNNPPTAVSDSFTVTQASMGNLLNVLANDSIFPDTDETIRVVSVGQGSSGTSITIGAFGTNILYTPSASFAGTDSFTYTITDRTTGGIFAQATVTITVTAVNESPMASNDLFATSEDATLNAQAPGVLGNDSDADGDALTSMLAIGPSHGTLVLDPSGGFTYSPNADYYGPDSFTYRASDGVLLSGVATVSIEVTSANDPPVAVDDLYSVAEDTPFSFPGRGVLFNDVDPDGDELTATLETGPAHGVLVLDDDGDFLYTPAANYNGPDGFTYRASDGEDVSNIATVSLIVNAVNDAPVAVADQYGALEDTLLTIAAPGVLFNDRDIDGDSLTASLVGVLFGHVGLNQDGSFVYTPPTDFTGEDRFLYVVSDGVATSAPVEVSINVQAVNDAPMAADDHYQATTGVPLTVPAPGVLTNDFDAEGDALTVSLTALPTGGTLVLNLGGGFTYTPDQGFAGPDSFTYQANDGQAFSISATVLIDVASGDSRPSVILGADAIVDEGSLFSRIGSFTDADGGDSWSATVDYGDGSGPQPLALNADKTFSLNHAYRDNGTFDLRVAVTDASGAAGSASISVQVRNVAPQALTFTGPALATRGQPLTFAGSFTDPGVADIHTARIDWGDGSVTTPAITGAAGGLRHVLASHTYSTGGIFEPTLTVADDDGGSASQRTTVLVAGVGLDRGVLEIVGSALGDSITVAFAQGGLNVFGTLGGATLSQSFAMASVERIVATLDGGNDRFTVSSTVPQPVLIDGGAGSDTLFAGGGQAILLGGSGNDALRGGSRRDVLIGGVGQDQLNASAGGDLLIAGWTTYDANYDALAAIFAEWNDAAAYQERVARLRSGSGNFVQPLGIKLAHNETVFDDAVADTLWGGSELDWFFLDITRDQLQDKVSAESIR